jgi:hypothetical protein
MVIVPPALVEFIRWQSEELAKSDGIAPCLGGTYHDGWVGAWRKISRMYLAPEPEVDRVDFYVKGPSGEYTPWKPNGYQRLLLEEIRKSCSKPEPSVPEGIKDLLYFSQGGGGIGINGNPIEANKLMHESDRRAVEAFYRGQKSMQGEGTGSCT